MKGVLKMKLDQCLDLFKNYSNISNAEKLELLKSMRKIKLLTKDSANAKTAKNSIVKGIRSYILHLSPANLAYRYIGRVGTVCPKASNGCAAACLNTAGRGRFDSIQKARIRKTLYFVLMRDQFLAQLNSEIEKLVHKAKKDNVKLAIRLNGTSDLPWYAYKDDQGLNVFERFSDVQFYDYTKVLRYLRESEKYSNWHLTFSASESNDFEAMSALNARFNVAMVFSEIPKQYSIVPKSKAYKTIDGDSHDLRFLDKSGGYIVALKAKGKAKTDNSGFVRHVANLNKDVA